MKNKKIILNGIWRNFFTFIFRYEKWNKYDEYYQLRIYLLWWEFNFSIKNKNVDRNDVQYSNDKYYKIITLCGSTKFKDQYMTEQKRLTLEGNIVISVGCFGHSDGEVWSKETKNMLDDIHKAKIDLADEIFVINVGGYIGSSTKNEIKYAKQTNKKINYLEKINK